MKSTEPNPPLGTVKQELAACRKAWKPFKAAKNWNGQLAWCCHHRLHIEPLVDNPFKRIGVILKDKATHEQPARLRSFRPVKPHPRLAALAVTIRTNWHERLYNSPGGELYDKALSRLAKLPLRAIHDKQYPGHAWLHKDGKVLNTCSW